jgi:cell division protein FtsB
VASGQQLAEENVRRFATWVASKSDNDFRGMVSRGMLSRVEIATECGFAKSALVQNPRIRDALLALEEDLRDRKVLPKAVTTASVEYDTLPTRQADSGRHAKEAERLFRLEQENASLKAENAELKRLLSRYSVIQDALAETGRLLR